MLSGYSTAAATTSATHPASSTSSKRASQVAFLPTSSSSTSMATPTPTPTSLPATVPVLQPEDIGRLSADLAEMDFDEEEEEEDIIAIHGSTPTIQGLPISSEFLNQHLSLPLSSSQQYKQLDLDDDHIATAMHTNADRKTSQHPLHTPVISTQPPSSSSLMSCMPSFGKSSSNTLPPSGFSSASSSSSSLQILGRRRESTWFQTLGSFLCLSSQSD